MKITFVLIFAAVLGVLPFSVLSVQAFVGFYTVGGILALAVYDYGRTTSRTRRTDRRPAAKRSEDGAASSPVNTWKCRTLSA
ncbi:MAG: hypothetical protein Q7S40_33225 [Opitutaceae bacterium]|nr:hypothetical protein [Opitutaceae bacterium]